MNGDGTDDKVDVERGAAGGGGVFEFGFRDGVFEGGKQGEDVFRFGAATELVQHTLSGIVVWCT